MPDSFPIYVIDDDPNIRGWAEMLFEDERIECRTFAGGDEFLAAFDELQAGCILLDMRMPKRSGLQVQTELDRRRSIMPVVAMTGFGDVEVAVQSMKLGALDFLEKPFDKTVLMEAVERAFQQLRERLG